MKQGLTTGNKPVLPKTIIYNKTLSATECSPVISKNLNVITIFSPVSYSDCSVVVVVDCGPWMGLSVKTTST